MDRRLREIGFSGVVALVVGYAIWPPGNVYWNAVADRIGLLPTIALVMGLCCVVGAAVASASDVSLANLAIGSGVSYTVGTTAVELVVSPFDVAEYTGLYGIFLGCFLLGATTVAARHGLAPGRAGTVRPTES